MSQKYTHHHSVILCENKECTSDEDFVDFCKEHRRKRFNRQTTKSLPTFQVEAFVSLNDNSLGFGRFVQEEARKKYYDSDDDLV